MFHNTEDFEPIKSIKDLYYAKVHKLFELSKLSK